MAINCNAPRNHEEDDAEPIDELAAKNDAKESDQIDADGDIEAAQEEFELPGVDLE